MNMKESFFFLWQKKDAKLTKKGMQKSRILTEGGL